MSREPLALTSSIKGPKAIFLISAVRGLAPGWLLCFMSALYKIISLWCLVSKLQLAVTSGGVITWVSVLCFMYTGKNTILLTNAQFLFFLLPFCLYQRGTEGFWKSVAHNVPREPTEMRILNPYFIQEAAFQFIGLPFNNGLMGKGVRLGQTQVLQSLNLRIFFFLIYREYSHFFKI